MFFVVHILFLILINWNLLFSYGGTAIVFKATNRNYTIIFITYNESSVIPKFPTCSAVFTGIRLPPYLSKLVNMVPWQKAINIGFTHFCATPARDTASSRWATVYYHLCFNTRTLNPKAPKQASNHNVNSIACLLAKTSRVVGTSDRVSLSLSFKIFTRSSQKPRLLH